MEAKVFEKRKAQHLRRKGYSLNEISALLKVSKSSASIWVKGVYLSDEAQKAILIKRQEGKRKAAEIRRNTTYKNLNEASSFAAEILKQVPRNKNQARVVASLLYWCEGEKSKNDKSLVFTNSDPLIVRAFLKNLRKGYELDENKFRVCVHLHVYHEPQKQLRFWSKMTTIPLTQFMKPYLKKNTGINKRQGYAGCASVRYYDVRIARKVHALARAFLNS